MPAVDRRRIHYAQQRRVFRQPHSNDRQHPYKAALNHPGRAVEDHSHPAGDHTADKKSDEQTHAAPNAGANAQALGIQVPAGADVSR